MRIQIQIKTPLFHCNISVSFHLYMWTICDIFSLVIWKKKKLNISQLVKSIGQHYENRTNKRMINVELREMTAPEIVWQDDSRSSSKRIKLSYFRKCLLDLLSYARQNKKGIPTNWEIKGTIKMREHDDSEKMCCNKKKIHSFFIAVLMARNKPFFSLSYTPLQYLIHLRMIGRR